MKSNSLFFWTLLSSDEASTKHPTIQTLPCTSPHILLQTLCFDSPVISDTTSSVWADSSSNTVNRRQNPDWQSVSSSPPPLFVLLCSLTSTLSGPAGCCRSDSYYKLMLCWKRGRHLVNTISWHIMSFHSALMNWSQTCWRKLSAEGLQTLWVKQHWDHLTAHERHSGKWICLSHHQTA